MRFLLILMMLLSGSGAYAQNVKNIAKCMTTHSKSAVFKCAAKREKGSKTREIASKRFVRTHDNQGNPIRRPASRVVPQEPQVAEGAQ